MRRYLLVLPLLVMLGACASGPDVEQLQREYQAQMKSAHGLDEAASAQLARAVCGPDTRERAAALRANVQRQGGQGAAALPDVVRLGVPAYCPEHAELWR